MFERGSDPAIPRPAGLVLAGAVAAVLLVGHPVGLGTFLSAAAVAVAAQRPRDIERFEATRRIDLAYLDGLSSDAVPALARLPRGMRSCVLADDAVRLRGDDPWHAVNLSRQQARRVLVTIDGIDGPCRAH